MTRAPPRGPPPGPHCTPRNSANSTPRTPRSTAHSNSAGELPSPRPGDGGQPWTRFFDRARLYAATAHAAALMKDPRAADYVVAAVAALGPARVKARAVVLAEAALVAATLNELELCLDYGATAATLTRDLDVSVASDILYSVVPLVLPYSDTRAIRELLPQLTRLTHPIDREDEDEDDPETRRTDWRMWTDPRAAPTTDSRAAGHPLLDLARSAREGGGEVLVAVGGDQDVVLDPHADAAVLLGDRQVVELEVQARLDGQHHAGHQRGVGV